MSNLALTIVKEKCPYCFKGNVFTKSASLFSIPVMNKECECCHKKFLGEPGYFIGAMYVSYGIAVALGIALFLISKFILQIDSIVAIIGIIVLSILLISYKNYKWSRIIWLKIFPPRK